MDGAGWQPQRRYPII
jgi:hypothetical protein